MNETWPSRVDHDTQQYWLGLAERKLVLARCQECGHWIHPPRACCALCWSDRVGRDTPSGQATLYSYIVQPGAGGAPSKIIAWAELAEQERLLIVAELKGETPASVRIGSALRLEWIESGNSYLPEFRQEPHP